MLLSDQAILERIRTGDIQLVGPDGQPVINPTTGRERELGQLQAHGYDLRVNRVFSWGTNSWIDLADGERYTIKPGEFVVVGTYERIRLSRNVAATVHAMARMTIAGLNHISTTVHPGWAEDEPEPRYLLVAVSNVSKAPLTIKRRQRFCRLLFYDVSPSSVTAAPNLEMIKRRFYDIRATMQPRYARVNIVKGVGLVVIVVSAAAVSLWLVALRFPNISQAATGVIVAVLTLALTEIIRKYNWTLANYDLRNQDAD